MEPLFERAFSLQLYTIKRSTPNRRGQISTAAGLLVATRFATTKKGNRIGIATIDDRSGRLDLTLFGESLDQFGEKLQKIQLWWYLAK